MLIWVRTTGPMGFTSMAQAPYAERVYRVQEGKLVEVTQDFCGRIFSTQSRDFLEWTCYLTAEDIQEIGAPTQTPDQKSKTDGNCELATLSCTAARLLSPVRRRAC